MTTKACHGPPLRGTHVVQTTTLAVVRESRVKLQNVLSPNWVARSGGP